MTSTTRNTRRRTAAPAALEQPAKRRLSLSEVLERLLDSRSHAGAKTTACTLGRSASQKVYWELTATTDPEQVEQLVAAVDAVIAQHDRLTQLHPIPEGS